MILQLVETICTRVADVSRARRQKAEALRRLDEEMNMKLRDDFGFIDWFNTDVSRGFHIYQDDELADILEHKAMRHVFDVTRTPILKMFFYQSIPALNVEVNYNSPYHEKLVRELESLPESGTERENSLARIRYAAKKIGLRAEKCDADGRLHLADDLKVVWRNTTNGLISD